MNDIAKLVHGEGERLHRSLRRGRRQGKLACSLVGQHCKPGRPERPCSLSALIARQRLNCELQPGLPASHFCPTGPALPQPSFPQPAIMNAGTLSRALQPLQPAWRTYISSLERSPRLTKSCTSVVAALAGDALAQYISNSDKERWE